MRTELSLDLIYLGGARVSWGLWDCSFTVWPSLSLWKCYFQVSSRTSLELYVSVPGTFLFLSPSAASCLCHACRCLCDFWGIVCDYNIPVILLLGV